MAFVQLWVHMVFGTKNRYPFLQADIKEKAIAHIKENAVLKDIYIDCIDGHYDHLHCLVSLNADQSVSKVMQLIKGECANWINKHAITKNHFEWGDEYFASSVSPSMVNKVREYIKNQVTHHLKKTFMQEYNEFIAAYRAGLII